MSLNLTSTNTQQFSDTDIVSAVLSGNKGMFEILIRRYNPYLYKIGRTYGFNHQDTEDLMQETLISSYLNLRQFAERSSFKTWLVKIMLNQCYHKAHKHSYQKEQPTALFPDKSSFMFVQNNHSDSSKAIINRELNKVIEECLQALPQNYRTVFALRELTGLSIAETSDLMQITPSNVKVLLSRARAMLRTRIEKTYSPEEIYEFNLIYCDRIVNNVMKKVDELGEMHLLPG